MRFETKFKGRLVAADSVIEGQKTIRVGHVRPTHDHCKTGTSGNPVEVSMEPRLLQHKFPVMDNRYVLTGRGAAEPREPVVLDWPELAQAGDLTPQARSGRFKSVR
jgi:hypothetical protein